MEKIFKEMKSRNQSENQETAFETLASIITSQIKRGLYIKLSSKNDGKLPVQKKGGRPVSSKTATLKRK